MQKSRKVLAALATPVAVVAAGAMVYQASYAAFTGTTNNTGNEWSTGSVTLTDDDNGVSMFRIANLLPGQEGSKCIEVTANASVPSTVKGYTVNGDVTNGRGLQQHIKITIESGTGGTFGSATSCAGFTSEAVAVDKESLANLIASSTNFATGAGAWAVTPGAPAKRSYKISYKFDATGLSQEQLDTYQGAKVGVGVQWEMQTNE